jgi:hypothetical protein
LVRSLCIIGVCCPVLVVLRQAGAAARQRQGRRPCRHGAPWCTRRRSAAARSHLTGPAYGTLLRLARGDRQKVEFWIIEVQRQMPGHTRSDAIALLAERTAVPMAATA